MRETILDGARCLLGECCNILNQSGFEYIVVGGWSPFLLNSGMYQHPGTKDVDVLLKKGLHENELKSVIERFLDNGFYQSAKHGFQLLKEIEIKDYKFIYNIDLLHPDNQEKKPEMFVDHIDFPVKESEIISINYKGKTILLPKSDYFFDGFYDKYTDKFTLLDGSEKEIEFNLLNEAGIILSKFKSAFNPKRTRDAYDMYLALENNRNYSSSIVKLKNIIDTHESVKDSFDYMFEEKNMQILNNNITDWKANMNLYNPKWSAIPLFSKFRNDLGL